LGSTWRKSRDRRLRGTSSEARALIKQVVAALLVRGPEILCCQRTEYQTLPLKWEFPGGKIEAGEEPGEALERELEEELGIHAEIGGKVAQLQHTYLNGNTVELHFFRIDRYEGELQNRIFREIRWAHRHDLPALDFLEADRTLVQQIAEGKLL
jgi:8-oxo-dGTP diphosphatase